MTAQDTLNTQYHGSASIRLLVSVVDHLELSDNPVLQAKAQRVRELITELTDEVARA